MRTSAGALLAAGLLLASLPTLAGPVELLWLGHSTVRITSTAGKVVVIDPFLRKNPTTPARYRDLEALGEVHLILVTHGHADHVSDLAELARASGAQVVANFEYANQLKKLGIVEPSNVIPMNKGGTVRPLGRDIGIHMVPAEHSSSVVLRDLPAPVPAPLREATAFLSGGVPVGYVVELENGFTIYHSGDTAVFGDMALIHEFHRPDVALVCIGGHFTMGPEGAAYAVRELIRPKHVLPIHYGTYPVINRTPEEFEAALGDAPVRVLKARPGEAIEF